MNTSLAPYFSDVTGLCLHLLSDILLIGLCTYLTGGSDYQYMRLFGLERGSHLEDLQSLPKGVPGEDTFERAFKSICPEELENSLRAYGKSTLSDLSQKQIIIDGRKRVVQPTSHHLSEDIGALRTNYIGIWISHSKKMHAGLEQDMLHRIFPY